MKLTLAKGKSASRADIERLEHKIGEALPRSFLEFVSQHDGAEPETNIFKIGRTNESGVNGFIPICKIPTERANIENLPARAFPFAWAEGGNYVYLDVTDESVYFWDHEQPNPATPIASDFTAFIEMLKPFDPSSIKLRPGQVKSAWIDPDFLKSLDD